MSVFLQPLQTVTVGSGGVNSVTFSSIPQGFTDLVLKMSLRDGSTSGSNGATWGLTINNDVSNASYSQTRLFGTGSSVGSGNAANLYYNDTAYFPNTVFTSNTFGSSEVYIPNYTGSNYKSFIVDSVTENNSSAAYTQMIAGLWRNTSAINTLNIYDSGSGSYVLAQYSKISLYGVLRQGI